MCRVGAHKGYVADAGYDSEEEETQVDIIYEDQDIRTVSIKEALQKREFQLGGNSEDPSETFELRKIMVRPRKSRAWKKRHRPPEITVISPKGQSIQNAVVEIQNRKQSGRNTRARAAKTKAARKTNVEQRRRAHEGEKRMAFTEPSIFSDRAMSTGKRRHSERVSPGLGPGPAGGLRER